MTVLRRFETKRNSKSRARQPIDRADDLNGELRRGGALMIAGRQPHERCDHALRAGLRTIGVAQHHEVLPSAASLGLAMHAQKMVVVAGAGGKGRQDEIAAFGAAHLPLKAIVGIIALDQKTAARSPLADVDAARASARTATPRSLTVGRAAGDVNTGAGRVDDCVAARRSVVRSTFGDDDGRR